MSKRVMRYECSECERAYDDKGEADRCERWHVEHRENEAREIAWRKIDDASYSLTKEEIEQVAALLKSWGKLK